MNIIITLPRHLIDEICAGRKTIELRKCFPKLMRPGHDGVFILEKGTKNIICFCTITYIVPVKKTMNTFRAYEKEICIDKEWWLKYISSSKKIYLWGLSGIRKFEPSLNLEVHFHTKYAPQNFSYTQKHFVQSDYGEFLMY